MILALLLAAQTMPIPPLPKANPLPLASADDQAVMAPINALFAGMTAGDGAAILAQVRPEGGLTAMGVKPDGTHAMRRLTWADFAAARKAGPEKQVERLTDPAIEVDGDIAMVWSPYVYEIAGKVHHCGVDHFDLVRDNGAWKILNITWSQRTTGCEAVR